MADNKMNKGNIEMLEMQMKSKPSQAPVAPVRVQALDTSDVNQSIQDLNQTLHQNIADLQGKIKALEKKDSQLEETDKE